MMMRPAAMPAVTGAGDGDVNRGIDAIQRTPAATR